MGVNAYSTTPNLNTSISGIGIQEGCSAGNLNDALRQALADTKSMQNALSGYLFGLTLSNDGTSPNTVIDVAAGTAMDDTSQALIVAGAGSINFATTGAGGLDVGTVAVNSWYHCYVIMKADGTVSWLASTSLTPTMPSGYTYKRRIGSVSTQGAAVLIPFKQTGDIFIAPTSTHDLSSVHPPTASRSFVTLWVPRGVKVTALFRADITDPTSQTAVVFTSPDETDNPAQAGFADMANGTTFTVAGMFQKVTNTSGQIGYRGSSATTVLNLSTYGWVDTRGRLA
jgi:hypothetical protein